MLNNANLDNAKKASGRRRNYDSVNIRIQERSRFYFKFFMLWRVSKCDLSGLDYIALIQ